VEHHVHEEEALAFPALEADEELNGSLGAELVKLKLKFRAFPPVHQTLDLEVPARVAYNQWTQFEAFPHFMEDVTEVHQLDDAHVQWQLAIGGRKLAWTARIYEQIPDRRIAWTSVEGAVNAGSATFHPLTPASCRMLVELSYEPSGLVEDLGALLGVVTRHLRSGLRDFKTFIEARHQEDGAWRGRIEDSPIEPGPDPAPWPGRGGRPEGAPMGLRHGQGRQGGSAL
jgi:uncharacterized membrane protein